MKNRYIVRSIEKHNLQLNNKIETNNKIENTAISNIILSFDCLIIQLLSNNWIILNLNIILISLNIILISFNLI